MHSHPQKVNSHIFNILLLRQNTYSYMIGQKYAFIALFSNVPSCPFVRISKRELRCQGHVSIAIVVEHNNRPSRIIRPVTDSIQLP